MKEIVYEMIHAAEAEETNVRGRMDAMKASTFSISKWNEQESKLACLNERIRTLYELIGGAG